MKTLAGPQSGAQGDIVASRNRSGQFLRKRVSPRNPRTTAQRRARENMRTFSRLWSQSNFGFIGLLPAADESVSDITRLYLRKLRELKKLKRYRHVALAGSRVFVRAVQQVNGWEDKRHMFVSSAVVPPG